MASFPGTVMVGVMIAAYAAIFILSLIVLWRLVILLPILTGLAGTVQDFLRSDMRPPERRLMEIEDLLRLNRITQEEYNTKRQEILKDL
jgi:uncharacterized membrane protein